jgi:hypothetical protein
MNTALLKFVYMCLLLGIALAFLSYVIHSERKVPENGQCIVTQSTVHGFPFKYHTEEGTNVGQCDILTLIPSSTSYSAFFGDALFWGAISSVALLPVRKKLLT